MPTIPESIQESKTQQYQNITVTTRVPESDHTAWKVYSALKKVSLQDLLQIAMNDYIERNPVERNRK